MSKANIKLIIDTREKNNRAINAVKKTWAYNTKLDSEIKGLGNQAGDYAIEEYGRVKKGARVETKWLSSNGKPGDLFASLSSNYPRFSRELKALSENSPMSIVIAEGKTSDLMNHVTPGDINFGVILNTMITLETRYHIPFLFTERAEEWLCYYLYAFANNIERCEKTYRLTDKEGKRNNRKSIYIKNESILEKMLNDWVDLFEMPQDQLGTNVFMPFKSCFMKKCTVLMLEYGFSFWFLDGFSQKMIIDTMQTWEDKELDVVRLHNCGGPLKEPPETYKGGLGSLASFKGLDGITARRKRTARIAFSDYGEYPLVVVFDTQRKSSEALTNIEILEPGPLGKDIDKINGVGDIAGLKSIGKIRTMQNEYQSRFELYSFLRDYWWEKKRLEVKKCADQQLKESLESVGIYFDERESASVAKEKEKQELGAESTAETTYQKFHVPCVTEPATIGGPASKLQRMNEIIDKLEKTRNSLSDLEFLITDFFLNEE